MNRLAKLFGLVLLCLIPIRVWAVCSWVGSTGTAASCSRADVAECITDAAGKTDHVTVKIPDCSDTAWTSAITVDMSTGWANVTSLTIRGANSCTLNAVGQPTSCPTNINGYGFTIRGTPTKPWRITNMKLTGGSSFGLIFLNNGSNKSWRVDHIYFSEYTTKAFMSWDDQSYGVIDHCNFKNSSGAYVTIHTREALNTNQGNASWQRGRDLGGPDNIFIENNLFNYTGGAGQLAATDSDYGGRFVVRYNTLNDSAVMIHDTGARGALSWEIYNNTVNVFGSSESGFADLRGGSGVIYNNDIISAANNPFYSGQGEGISFHSLLVCGTNGTDNGHVICDGGSGHQKYCLGVTTSSSKCTTDAQCGGESGACQEWDTVGGNGYPCRDQIGVKDDLTSQPALVWNNRIKKSGGAFSYITPVVRNTSTERTECAASATFTGDNYIVNNRDYCFNNTTMPSSCNGVATTYVPYTYPHPLTLTTPRSAQNIRVVNTTTTVP